MINLGTATLPDQPGEDQDPPARLGIILADKGRVGLLINATTGLAWRKYDEEVPN